MPANPRILVVDDELAALELIGQTLTALGTEPKCIHSSRLAAELIQKEKFDGVFLDWMMPERTAWNWPALSVARNRTSVSPS